MSKVINKKILIKIAKLLKEVKNEEQEKLYFMNVKGMLILQNRKKL